MSNTGTLQETIDTISQGMAMASLIGIVVTALLQCFFGFRFLRFWVAFAGFGFGILLGYRYLAPLVLSEGSAWYLAVLVGVILGVVLAIFSYKLFKVGLFLFCGGVAWYAVSTLVDGVLLEYGQMASMIITVLACALAFVLAGWLAVSFFRPAVILITSIGGAWSASHTLLQIVPQFFTEPQNLLILFGILAGAGILVQFLTTRK